MRIEIILTSEFFSEEENEYFDKNRINNRWPFNYIPSKNDEIRIQDFIEEKYFTSGAKGDNTSFFKMSFCVEKIVWRKEDLFPIIEIYLLGR